MLDQARVFVPAARRYPDPFLSALWLSSLLVAVDPAVNPLPAHLDEFVTTYLALVRPAARA